jgi:hypothetical protein
VLQLPRLLPSWLRRITPNYPLPRRTYSFNGGGEMFLSSSVSYINPSHHLPYQASNSLTTKVIRCMLFFHLFATVSILPCWCFMSPTHRQLMKSDFLSAQYVNNNSSHLLANIFWNSVPTGHWHLSNHICCPHHTVFDHGGTSKYHHQSYCIQNWPCSSTVFHRSGSPSCRHGTFTILTRQLRSTHS